MLYINNCMYAARNNCTLVAYIHVFRCVRPHVHVCFVYAAHIQYGCIVRVARVQHRCTVCAARKQIYVQHTSNISVRESSESMYLLTSYARGTFVSVYWT